MFLIRLAVANFVFLTLLVSTAQSQSAGQIGRDRFQLQSTLNVQNSRINEQRALRITEIGRLEQLITEMGSRLTRLERQSISVARLPAISIAEAEAEVEFAETQLQEYESKTKDDQTDELQLARARLALVRARGQLETAKAAHAENKAILELDVAYARRELLRATNEKAQMERLVAKGYASSDALKFRLMDLDLAEKQLQLATVRLDAQRKSSGETREQDDSSATTAPVD